MTTDSYLIVPDKRLRMAPLHPGYLEGIFVQGTRQFAGLAMCTALAIALGGGHMTVAIVAGIPFLARMTHVFVPRLVARYTSWSVARAAIWIERFGFLAAAVVGSVRPGEWTIPLFLVAIAAALLGQALYDGAMAALHSEVAAPGAFGEYTSEKTRWAALSGLVLGILASLGVGQLEANDFPAHIVRALAIATGVAVHCLVARPFARMGDIARMRAKRAERLPSPVAPLTAASRSLLPRSRDEWSVVYFALAWGFAFGIGARQTEAMALRTLGVSIGMITLFNALLVGAGMLGAKTWGRLSDRFGGRGLMILAIAAFAIDPIWSLLAMFGNPLALFPAYIIWGVFNTGWTIAQSVALVKTVGPPADRIRLISMYNVAHGLAAGTAPLLGGALLTWLDGPLTTKGAFAALFGVTMLCRLATIPVLKRLPAEHAAGARRVSAVYMRLLRGHASMRTRAITAALKPRRVRMSRKSLVVSHESLVVSRESERLTASG